MLGRNVLIGLAGSVWSAALGFAVIPFYLHYLGVEAYGLVGFFATLQAVVQLLDMGLAPTINREVSRASAEGDISRTSTLLRTLARVYWLIAALIAVVILGLSLPIADHWLKAEHLSPATLQHAVSLLGVVIACRWPIGLYQGVLLGAQRIPAASAINIAMATLGGVGAVTVLALVSATIEAFFAWQVTVGLTHAMLMRHAAWNAVGREPGAAFSWPELRRIWRFSASMGGIAVLGLVFTQMDKVMLSRILDLRSFAHYMLAATVVSGLYVLITPMFNALYPRFTSLAALRDHAGTLRLYRLCTQAVGCGLFPLAMFLVVSSRDLILLWTRDDALALATAPVVAVMAAGSALHGVMHIPHALQLAHGETRLPLAINGILIVIMVPLIAILALHHGALGGAIAWLVLHVLYVALGAWLTHRRLLVGIRSRWLLRDVGMPLGISGLCGAIALWAGVALQLTHPLNIVVGVVASLCAATIAVLASSSLRGVVRQSLSSALGTGSIGSDAEPLIGK
ncbi:oligosaccharide flippase family protein [Rhizobacter sp. SG703]|uniref:lipopolysaccharide biosynthesis protein n=1 Tax=Rhizobacter sp. SG703 TaxID=2587140 RepID=UPI00144587BC|nr:oligosaccharide flippase family protein [Rhizobacter sp. SG703]NKI95067.1 O-antigen/teichoic acid export membrane protein [Rhizobacter sp. SG703]